MDMEQELPPTQLGHTGYNAGSSMEEEIDPITPAVCHGISGGRLKALLPSAG